MAGLYIHIPFCRAKCAYCDFYSGPLRTFNPEAYTRALARELEARAAQSQRFSTVYIGGGTPSSVPPELLTPFLELADGEATVEVNPEDVTDHYARRLRAAGANRVSMGVQSLDDEELRAIGRRHDRQRAISAFHSLRGAGFDNISLDLIYGLPGQDTDSWRRSLNGVLDLAPEHLSAYILSYEPGTLLHTRRATGRITETDDETIAAMYGELCSATRAAGFSHYEISNFALPGRRSRHNSSYWDLTPYLGLGPGAHSFDGTLRSHNPADLRAYLANPAGVNVIESENADERHNDMLLTALRTARGIHPSVFTPSELDLAQRLLTPTDGDRLRIAEPDWLLADSIISRLLRV